MLIIKVFILSLIICIDSFILCFLNKNKNKLFYILVPFIFSFFQISFLLTGYFIGDFLENYIYDHLKHITFVVFSSMALKLLIDIIITKGKEKTCHFSLKDIVFQAALTSFDSLFLGLPLAFGSSSYLIFVFIVGTTTFLACLLGLLLKSKTSDKYDNKISIIGALILFIFALKSLV